MPAIKPAAKRTRSGNIALLATPATVKSPYTDQLITDFAKSCRIIKKPTMKLVELAERKIAGENVLGPCRMELADISAMAEIDVVVLACTHFIHLREELQEIFSKSTELLDPVNAIVDRVIYLLGEESSAYDSLDECDVLSFATTNYLENLKSGSLFLTAMGDNSRTGG